MPHAQTTKRKRCKNGTRKNKIGDCVPYVPKPLNAPEIKLKTIKATKRKATKLKPNMQPTKTEADADENKSYTFNEIIDMKSRTFDANFFHAMKVMAATEPQKKQKYQMHYYKQYFNGIAVNKVKITANNPYDLWLKWNDYYEEHHTNTDEIPFYNGGFIIDMAVENHAGEDLDDMDDPNNTTSFKTLVKYEVETFGTNDTLWYTPVKMKTIKATTKKATKMEPQMQSTMFENLPTIASASAAHLDENRLFNGEELEKMHLRKEFDDNFFHAMRALSATEPQKPQKYKMNYFQRSKKLDGMSVDKVVIEANNPYDLWLKWDEYRKVNSKSHGGEYDPGFVSDLIGDELEDPEDPNEKITFKDIAKSAVRSFEENDTLWYTKV